MTEPTKTTLARRRNAAKRRQRIEQEGRRMDLLLDKEPAAALAALERSSGQRPTTIIGRLLIEAARHG